MVGGIVVQSMVGALDVDWIAGVDCALVYPVLCCVLCSSPSVASLSSLPPIPSHPLPFACAHRAAPCSLLPTIVCSPRALARSRARTLTFSMSTLEARFEVFVRTRPWVDVGRGVGR